MLYYNFSGHPAKGFEVAPLVGVNIPIENGEQLQQFMRELLLSLPHRDELLAGASATVILPGLAPAAAVLLAEWHGQFGNFPKIKWAVRGESGFVFTDEASIDLNAVRLSARTAR